MLEPRFIISNPSEKYALSHVKKFTGLQGRWDIIQQNPVIIKDVAHNADGIKQVLQQLYTNYPDAVLHFVLGFVRDKDIDHLLGLFPENARYYFTNAHIPRALPHEELKKLASEKNLAGESYDDVNTAIEEAKSLATEKDVIMICGSFFIIAEIS